MFFDPYKGFLIFKMKEIHPISIFKITNDHISKIGSNR
jgi:hypothetical protein